MKIKEYFKNSELECPCGCGLMPDKRALERLYAFRLIKNKPVILTSAARCETYNEAVGGAEDSAHLVGGFDIKSIPEEEWENIRIAQMVGFTAIGINNNKFMHVDDKHDSPTIWTY